MTVEEIRNKVRKIKKIQYDDEAAHFYEDELYLEFIQYVAKNGTEEFSEMAKECLKTKKLEFSRWCA